MYAEDWGDFGGGEVVVVLLFDCGKLLRHDQVIGEILTFYDNALHNRII